MRCSEAVSCRARSPSPTGRRESGRPHLGLTFAHHGREADGAPGLVVDMNARGDSQQHGPYAERLYGWPLRRWTHAVMPMADPIRPRARWRPTTSTPFPGSGDGATTRSPRPRAASSTGAGRRRTRGLSTRPARSSTSTSRAARGGSSWTGSSRATATTRSRRTSWTISTGRSSTATPRRSGWRSACPSGSTGRSSMGTDTTTDRSRPCSWSRPRRPGSKTSSRAR